MKNLYTIVLFIACCMLYSSTYAMEQQPAHATQTTSFSRKVMQTYANMFRVLGGYETVDYNQLALVPQTNQTSQPANPTHQITVPAAQLTPVQPAAPVVVNVNNYTSANAANSNDIINANTNTNSNTLTSFIKLTGDHALQSANGLLAFCMANQKKLAFYAFLTAYASAYIRLYRDKQNLYTPATWARWKENTPTESLYTIPSKELTRELLLDIQRMYLNPKEPNNFIFPFIQFLQAVEAEEISIRRYIQWGGWILTVRAGFFFPVNYDALLLAQLQSTRLAFVKHLFISWAAEHNLSENTKQ